VGPEGGSLTHEWARRHPEPLRHGGTAARRGALSPSFDRAMEDRDLNIVTPVEAAYGACGKEQQVV